MRTINALRARMNEEELQEMRRQAITDLINTRFGTQARRVESYAAGKSSPLFQLGLKKIRPRVLRCGAPAGTLCPYCTTPYRITAGGHHGQTRFRH